MILLAVTESKYITLKGELYHVDCSANAAELAEALELTRPLGSVTFTCEVCGSKSNNACAYPRINILELTKNFSEAVQNCLINSRRKSCEGKGCPGTLLVDCNLTGKSYALIIDVPIIIFVFLGNLLICEIYGHQGSVIKVTDIPVEISLKCTQESEFRLQGFISYKAMQAHYTAVLHNNGTFTEVDDLLSG